MEAEYVFLCYEKHVTESYSESNIVLLLNLSCYRNSQSQSHSATDGQSVSMSWCQAQIWDIWPEIFF
jgi:hypothetical protein